MSQYDNMYQVTYQFPAVAFGSGTTTAKLYVPRTVKQARVLDIFVAGTVLFTQVTTPALVQVGDGTTANAFAQLTVGALAAGNTVGGSDTPAVGVWRANYLAGSYNAGAGLHDLIATFVAPTGGTPAGTGTVTIIMGYDQIMR
jgi:hypothetical protein